jgi:hypothetical protein
MAVQTWLQASPKALPYLTDGENHFILYGPSRATPSLVSDSGSPDAHITFENGLRISFTHGKPPPAIAAAGSDNPGTEGEKPASR